MGQNNAHWNYQWWLRSWFPLQFCSLQRNYSYGTEISVHFIDICPKPSSVCILFKFDTCFFSCCIWLVWVVLNNLYLSLHVLWFLLLCPLISVVNPTGNISQNSQKEWNLFKVNKDTRITSMFLMSPCQWSRSKIFVNFEQIAHLVLEFLLLTLNR